MDVLSYYHTPIFSGVFSASVFPPSPPMLFLPPLNSGDYISFNIYIYCYLFLANLVHLVDDIFMLFSAFFIQPFYSPK